MREKTLDNILSYSALNRLTQSADTGETGTRSLSYDTRGNVRSIGGQVFKYDATDRPTGLTGDTTGAHRYDGHVDTDVGRRVKSIIVNDDGKKTTRYNVYDASGALVYIVQRNNSDGSQSYNTIYAQMDGQSVARIKTTGWYGNYADEITWLHHDHLGSAVAGTDETGTVAWTEKYTPYGISLMNDAANDNQAGFTGHMKDTDTGLTYMQARYYDPVVSRFLSHDPEGFLSQKLNPGYFNRYMYVKNDPVNMIDPNGEIWGLVRKIVKVIAKGGDVASVTAGAVADSKVLFSKNTGGWARLGAGLSLASEIFSPVSARDAKNAVNAVKPKKKGPKPNGGDAKPHGGQPHNDAIDNRVDELKADPDVSNIRKNQAQVDVDGNKVGNNRPDVQFDKNGCHHCEEFDTRAGNGQKHAEVIRENDPNTIIRLEDVK